MLRKSERGYYGNMEGKRLISMEQRSNTDIEPLNPEVFYFNDMQWVEEFTHLTFTPEDLQTLNESMDSFIDTLHVDDTIQDFLKREEQEILNFQFDDTDIMQDIKDMLEREDRELKELAKGW